MPRYFFSLALLTSAFLFPFTGYAASGESWEYTSTMKMEGMNMPPMKLKVCQEPGWKSPPKGDGQSKCKIEDYQKNGDRMKWKVTCPEGSGRGEVTLQGDDKFTGFTEFTTAQGKMQMDMSGRKLGSCDPAASPNTLNGKAAPNQETIKALREAFQQQQRN